MSKVGMIILNYNDYETTNKYINKIKDYKVLDEIIIVDNKSTDKSFEKLKKINRKKISVIETNENKGYAYGNNYGINYLNKNFNVDYVIISNPDIIVEEEDIIRLKNDLDNNEEISLIAPVVEQLGDIKRGWRLPLIKDEILSNINYFQRRVQKKLEYSDDKFKGNITRVDVVSGCFFMIRNDILNLIGNFDTNTFLYYEENILACKLKNINAKTYIDNNAKVIHDLSVSVNKSFNSVKKYKMLKNSQKYYVKYYLKPNKIEMLLLRLTYRISLGIAYIVNFFRRRKNK